MSRFYDPQGLPLNLGDIYQGRLPGFGPEGLLAAAAAGFPASLGSIPGFPPSFPLGLPPAGLPPGIMIPRQEGVREERDSPASSAGSSVNSEKHSTHLKKRRTQSNSSPSHEQDKEDISSAVESHASFEALSAAAANKMSLHRDKLCNRQQNNTSPKSQQKERQQEVERHPDDEETDNEEDVSDKRVNDSPQGQQQDIEEEEDDEEETSTRESSPSRNTSKASSAAPISCPISC